jgi:hypothetical protein
MTPIQPARRLVNRAAPDGYQRPPLHQADRIDYYLTPQSRWTGATPLFTVQMREPGAEHILAERCLAAHGMLIVDALREKAQRDQEPQ